MRIYRIVHFAQVTVAFPTIEDSPPKVMGEFASYFLIVKGCGGCMVSE